MNEKIEWSECSLVGVKPGYAFMSLPIPGAERSASTRWLSQRLAWRPEARRKYAGPQRCWQKRSHLESPVPLECRPEINSSRNTSSA